MKDALRKHAHGYVLCIEILRAIALVPDGVRFHELLDWFNLYPDTCAGAVMELLQHRFADIDDKNAPSQIRVTPEGADFLVQRGLIAPCKGQFERLRSETMQIVGWMARWERDVVAPYPKKECFQEPRERRAR